MDYFYDVLININEEKAYEFYEWDNTDPIELIKKIPIFRVNSNILKDIFLYNIQVKNEFLDKIRDKTILKNSKLNNIIKYACIFCDTKNSIVVEFDDKGNVIGRSNLLLDDDANIIEIIYNYQILNLEYLKFDNIKNFKSLRQEDLMKKIIEVEIKTLIENNNYSKLKYLYNECFESNEDNIEIIENQLLKILNTKDIIKLKNIYDVIIMSYNIN